MKKKKVIITGINGQDGAYLAQYLLKKKKYKVFGFIRRSSNYKLTRLDYLKITDKINFFNVELTEHKRIEEIIKKLNQILFITWQLKALYSIRSKTQNIRLK